MAKASKELIDALNEACRKNWRPSSSICGTTSRASGFDSPEIVSEIFKATSMDEMDHA